MIVSHEWIRQFVPHTLSALEVGEALSRHCVTLDRIETMGTELTPFVVARVIEAGPHPDSDHLWVTKVDDGSGELLDVVCGAPKVVVGACYPFARTGTLMPGGIRIEKRKIRGEVSNGMLCSARELGLGDEHHGILELDTDALPGTPLLEVIRARDWKLELDVLPNRPDLLSHIGVAREVSAITGTPMSLIPGDITVPTTDIAIVEGLNAAKGEYATIILQDAVSCTRFIGVVITGVQVTDSPEWLRRRLSSIGLRSISNVVDATNYVLHGLGHPVHAYDLATLRNRTIRVRQTRPDEPTLMTLDGVSRIIPAGTTVICDDERPVALAGVMGGLDTEVTGSTTDILLELAVFDPRFVRRVRKMAGLSTDASYRFERGVDAHDAEAVARVTASLITQVAGGDVCEVLVVGEPIKEREPVTLRPRRLARLLGVGVAVNDIVRHLESLGCTVRKVADDLSVSAPGWRHDLSLEVDLIEEVARLIGFDSFPQELRPFRPGSAPDHPLHLVSRRVRDLLVGMGMAETRPMPFTSTGGIGTPRVLNPLNEDEPFLRASVLDTLARRAEHNLSRMQGNLRLFEIGSVFTSRDELLPAEEIRVGALLMGARRPRHFTEPDPPNFDIWDVKEVAARVTAAAYRKQAFLHAIDGGHGWLIEVEDVGVVGRASEVTLDRPVWASPAWGVELTLGVISSDNVALAGHHGYAPVRRDSGVLDAVRFMPLPVTPAAEFDLALFVPDEVAAATVDQALRQAGGELLERVELFDEFRGTGVPEGSRSLAWRLTWRHAERTLRDKELESRRARLLTILEKELGIRSRAP